MRSITEDTNRELRRLREEMASLERERDRLLEDIRSIADRLAALAARPPKTWQQSQYTTRAEGDNPPVDLAAARCCFTPSRRARVPFQVFARMFGRAAGEVPSPHCGGLSHCSPRSRVVGRPPHSSPPWRVGSPRMRQASVERSGARRPFSGEPDGSSRSAGQIRPRVRSEWNPAVLAIGLLLRTRGTEISARQTAPITNDGA